MTNGNEYQLGRGAEGVDRCLMTNVFNSDYSFSSLPSFLPWSLSESETSTSKICKWWRFHRWKSSKLLFKNSQTNMNFCNVFQPCLVITIDDKHYLVDTGFGRRSPRSSFYCSLRAALWSFTLAQLSQLMIDWNLITCLLWLFSWF